MGVSKKKKPLKNKAPKPEIPESASSILLLSCPFHARNCKLGSKSGSCWRCAFNTPARLIEHLKRKHNTEPTAPSRGADEPIGHVTDQQLAEIHSIQRLKDPGIKWKKIYKILFPDDEDSPNPYDNPWATQFRRQIFNPSESKVLEYCKARNLTPQAFKVFLDMISDYLNLMAPQSIDEYAPHDQDHGSTPSSSAATDPGHYVDPSHLNDNSMIGEGAAMDCDPQIVDGGMEEHSLEATLGFDYFGLEALLGESSCNASNDY
ncbi:hypothetical protein BX600DRAFT_448798 [Xylariales sp. PMI_506]|nr:hypothetical protein BX600DRAFT_448798 [Xylariales sp. PMI_506]